ncbi:beta-xylosidase [Paenibacillus sp. V4I7]|nr:beta-xylosidase [Paenibacillus sp. V4I7]
MNIAVSIYYLYIVAQVKSKGETKMETKMERNQDSISIWAADLGNGNFRNPVIYADYSDPDVVRVGEDFYMTASSFNSSPGLPILHSKDLVNWQIIAHAVDRLPGGYDNVVRHGDGVWAPSIRFHDGKFWIYFSAPDEGIYMTTAEEPKGPWSPLHLVKEVKGWIDPCPFWDEDGEAYLIHAFAKSRTGIKHKLKLCRMSADGKELLDDGEVIFDGEADHPTMEGPKLYKRNGYYYIFAPAGGVPTGWQTILRSRSITGPYEDKIVLHQGDTEINGPHQGGYVELSSGESWFVHFQDREAYGRIVHLQPIRWENDWPVMGIDSNDDGIGEPVLVHKKPDVGRDWPITVPTTSDEFESPSLGLQWQWQANWKTSWYSLKDSPGKLRLYAEPLPIGVSTLYHTPNVLCQKLPAPALTATAKLTFQPGTTWDRAGFTVFGHEYRYMVMSQDEERFLLTYVQGKGSKEGSEEEILEKIELPAGVSTVYFKVTIVLEAECSFAYSLDGEHFVLIGDRFTAVPGGWVGAKLGLFCLQQQGQPGGGYVDVDWFRVKEQ